LTPIHLLFKTFSTLFSIPILTFNLPLSFIQNDSVMIHGIVMTSDEPTDKESAANKMNVEVEPTVNHTVDTVAAVDSVHNPVNVEPILGAKRSTLTALQRRKKKVKESGGVRLSHLEEDDDAEES
jgi:hypothetical protein